MFTKKATLLVVRDSLAGSAAAAVIKCCKTDMKNDGLTLYGYLCLKLGQTLENFAESEPSLLVSVMNADIWEGMFHCCHHILFLEMLKKDITKL